MKVQADVRKELAQSLSGDKVNYSISFTLLMHYMNFFLQLI